MISLNENFKTTEHLKRFKYFNLLFKEYVNHENNINGYYVNVNKTNLPLVKSFIRFMYPQSFQHKIDLLDINSCILIKKETHNFDLTHMPITGFNRRNYWSFEFGFDIDMVVSNILLSRRMLEQQKKMIQQHYRDMTEMYLQSRPYIIDYPSRI